MDITKIKSMPFGITINNFNANKFCAQDIAALKELVYKEKIVLLKNQDVSPKELVFFGKQFGELREYYEEMYHHASEKEIFVSSNILENGLIQGVPKTGKFWHSDYAFMQKPFAITLTYPQVVPEINRGTYFIDMSNAYEQLDDKLKASIEHARCNHTVRKYFKIRPKDVYRPMSEILHEIETKTPEVSHPTVVVHPVTGKKILYVNEGFTIAIDNLLKPHTDNQQGDVLRTLLDSSGQLDNTFTHPNIQLLEIEKGDMILWDNRQLVHHAKHTTGNEPSKTFRLTIYDEFPFSATN